VPLASASTEKKNCVDGPKMDAPAESQGALEDSDHVHDDEDVAVTAKPLCMLPNVSVGTETVKAQPCAAATVLPADATRPSAAAAATPPANAAIRHVSKGGAPERRGSSGMAVPRGFGNRLAATCRETIYVRSRGEWQSQRAAQHPQSFGAVRLEQIERQRQSYGGA